MRDLPGGRVERTALVDVNSFYVSCERAFDPKLEGKPGSTVRFRTAAPVAASSPDPISPYNGQKAVQKIPSDVKLKSCLS